MANDTQTSETTNEASTLSQSSSSVEKVRTDFLQASTRKLGHNKALIDTLEEPRSVEETGIPEEIILDLILKSLYFDGSMTGLELAQSLALNFSAVVDPLLQALKRRHLVEVTSGAANNQALYIYAITDRGAQRTREILIRNGYAGPCPVSLSHYVNVMNLQIHNRPKVRAVDVRRAMQNLVLSDDVLDRIGPAVNSFRSIFIYGPSGNGKTSVAKAIAEHLMTGYIMVPKAIYAHGQIIQVFDDETHEAMHSEGFEQAHGFTLDKRWVYCKPPIIIAGGELNLSDLDLSWSESSRYYEAPLQLKANGGLFLVDDFGRQQMPPRDLLNRWIVPLEDRMDYFTFHTGKKFAVPFEALIVFSTNLDPHQLIDDAFLRRIRHKLGIDDPTKEQFYKIFVAACQERGMAFNREVFVHLLREHYAKANREVKACHPRDLLDQLNDFADYRGETPEMTIEAIDEAARSYFAELF